MSDSELKKIVNDGYNKFKAFEEGKKALEALDSLKQANSDLSKTVKELEKKRDGLLAENEKTENKVSEADKKAAFIIGTAEAKASSILESVNKSLADAQEKADKVLHETNQKIARQQTLADTAEKEALAAKAKLDAINSELENAKARLKALVG